MSGPKCDEFDLFEEFERMERERIREQIRQEKLREKAEQRRRMIEEQQRREEEQRRKEEEERHRKEEERRRKEEEERRRKEEEERRRKEEERQRIERENASDEFNLEEEEALAELEELLYSKRKDEIVANAIDAVMEEMGYELIASMTPPTQPEDHLIQAHVFSFGDGSGIQVMEAGGQVSLEVVGIGTNDRTPTDKEAEFLEEKMEEFCQNYQELTDRLAKHGIIRTHVKYHQNPDKKYARILNINNFNKEKEVDTLQFLMKNKEKKKSEQSGEILSLQKVQQSRSDQ